MLSERLSGALPTSSLPIGESEHARPRTLNFIRQTTWRLRGPACLSMYTSYLCCTIEHNAINSSKAADLIRYLQLHLSGAARTN